MTALLGKGMDAADKKTQELKLQSELNRIATSKEKALADLGRAVIVREGSHPSFAATYADQVKAIGDLEAQEEAIRQRLEALQVSDILVSGTALQTATAAVQGHACPACGTPVVLEAMYCPSCGDNLATLKAQFKKCPTCNIYYPQDSAFCEKCGTKTVMLEIAKAITSTSEPQKLENEVGQAAPEAVRIVEETTPAVNACSFCGAPLKPGAAFCGSCGARQNVFEAVRASE